MSEQVHPAWRRVLAPLLSTTLILSISSILALTLALGTPPLLGQIPRAWACGISAQTMLANNAPAIPVPGSQALLATNQGSTNLPGFFPGDYYRGQAITFTEDLSQVPGAPPKDSVQWRWDFGDGSSYGSGSEPTHTYQRAEKYTINVSNYDDIDKTWNPFDTATITILETPWSNPPIAKATADKTLVALNDTVTFDATGSHAVVGTQLTYEWNFGDGSPDTQGTHVTYQFSIPGRALVTLIVKDSRGAPSAAVIPIQVVTFIPQVHLKVSATSATVGQTITFDASQVQLEGGDSISKYIWNFGDQTPAQTTTTSTIIHSYTKPGRYQVQVQAIDAQNVPGTATVNITIQSAANAGSGSSGSSLSHTSFTLIGLGLLIVLALGVLFAASLWRRRAAPATQGRGSASQRSPRQHNPSGGATQTARRTIPRQPSAGQPSGTRPATNSRARPPQRPPNSGPERQTPGKEKNLRESFYRDEDFPQG